MNNNQTGKILSKVLDVLKKDEYLKDKTREDIFKLINELKCIGEAYDFNIDEMLEGHGDLGYCYSCNEMKTGMHDKGICFECLSKSDLYRKKYSLTDKGLTEIARKELEIEANKEANQAFEEHIKGKNIFSEWQKKVLLTSYIEEYKFNKLEKIKENLAIILGYPSKYYQVKETSLEEGLQPLSDGTIVEWTGFNRNELLKIEEEAVKKVDAAFSEDNFILLVPQIQVKSTDDEDSKTFVVGTECSHNLKIHQEGFLYYENKEENKGTYPLKGYKFIERESNATDECKKMTVVKAIEFKKLDDCYGDALNTMLFPLITLEQDGEISLFGTDPYEILFVNAEGGLTYLHLQLFNTIIPIKTNSIKMISYEALKARYKQEKEVTIEKFNNAKPEFKKKAIKELIRQR